MSLTYEKGRLFELEVSKTFHQQGVPLLVCAKLLRRKNLGQIDMARVISRSSRLVIEVQECKSGGFLSARQLLRLRRASHFLGELFGVTSFLQVIHNQKSLASSDCIL